MASKKKVEKAAKVRGNSVTKYVRTRMSAGVTNVETILEGIRKEFPKTKATPGYVRHIARHIVGKALPESGKKTKVTKPKKAKSPKPSKTKTDEASESSASASA